MTTKVTGLILACGALVMVAAAGLVLSGEADAVTPTPTPRPGEPRVGSLTFGFDSHYPYPQGQILPLQVYVSDLTGDYMQGQEVALKIGSEPGIHATLNGQKAITVVTGSVEANLWFFTGLDDGTVTILATAGSVTAQLEVVVAGSFGLCSAPTPPASYMGSVRIDGVPVPDGLTVRGFVHGLEWGRYATQDGRYWLNIPQFLPVEPPCFQPGEVTFQLEGLAADESAGWRAGLIVLDLTFHGPVPAPQALPPPWWELLPNPWAWEVTPTPPPFAPTEPPTTLTATATPWLGTVATPAAAPAGGLGAQPSDGQTWWPLLLLAAGALCGFGGLALWARGR